MSIPHLVAHLLPENTQAENLQADRDADDAKHEDKKDE